MGGDPKLLELQQLIPRADPQSGLGRTANEQALYQVAATLHDQR
jgi:hypothetical protein